MVFPSLERLFPSKSYQQRLQPLDCSSPGDNNSVRRYPDRDGHGGVAQEHIQLTHPWPPVCHKPSTQTGVTRLWLRFTGCYHEMAVMSITFWESLSCSLLPHMPSGLLWESRWAGFLFVDRKTLLFILYGPHPPTWSRVIRVFGLCGFDRYTEFNSTSGLLDAALEKPCSR